METIIESKNDYIGALKENQLNLLRAVEKNFQAGASTSSEEKGHGRIEKRTVRISHKLEGIPSFPGLKTLIKVESERQVKYKGKIKESKETRYYIASFVETVEEFAERIRKYWGVENKVHYVRDVTQGEDASRIRTTPLIQIWAIARNLALNLYRTNGYENMAQAQRQAGFCFNILKILFRMK